ncbi:MAG: DUF2231 domain-containing protein, partial [Sphingomonadales bacterium]
MPTVSPNWHPFLVHFTIALFFTSFFFLLTARIAGKKFDPAELKTAGRWTLWASALITALTLATGTYAYFTVAHDAPSHAAMTDHRNWALATGTVIILLGVWSFLKWRGDKAQPSSLLGLMALGVIMLSVTGLKGGGLVYEYGLGVASLPKAEEVGHSHEAGEEHETKPVPAKEKSPVSPGSPEAAVDAFEAALVAGDEAMVRALLASDVLIYESGGAERSLEEYASHHMPADMAFVAAMKREQTDRRTFMAGDMAIVTTLGHSEGVFRDREINI